MFAYYIHILLILFYSIRVFLGQNHKFIKKINLSKFNDDNSEQSVKCKIDEIDKILSLKKLVLEQPRYERK